MDYDTLKNWTALPHTLECLILCVPSIFKDYADLRNSPQDNSSYRMPMLDPQLRGRCFSCCMLLTPYLQRETQAPESALLWYSSNFIFFLPQITLNPGICPRRQAEVKIFSDCYSQCSVASRGQQCNSNISLPCYQCCKMLSSQFKLGFRKASS